MKPDKCYQRLSSEAQTRMNLVKKHLKQLYNIDTKLGKLYIVSQLAPSTVAAFKEAKEYGKILRKIDRASKKRAGYKFVFGFSQMQNKLGISDGVAVLFWKTLTQHEKELYKYM